MAAQPRRKKRIAPANALPMDDPAPTANAPVVGRAGAAARKPKPTLNIKRILGLSTLLVMVGIGAFPTFLVLACGLAPTFVAMVVQEKHMPFRVRTIGVCNLAAVMPQIALVWQRGHHIDAATQLLSDPYVWATMYLGAAAGLLLLWAGPIVAAAIYSGMAVQRRRNLDGVRKKLIEEWGDGVIAAHDKPPPPGGAGSSA